MNPLTTLARANLDRAKIRNQETALSILCGVIFAALTVSFFL